MVPISYFLPAATHPICWAHWDFAVPGHPQLLLVSLVSGTQWNQQKLCDEASKTYGFVVTLCLWLQQGQQHMAFTMPQSKILT